MQTIAKAFVAAQKAFGPALKTATNPHFKSRYADLSACVEAVMDSLNDNGIALIQNTHESDNGVIVETIFMHESGETISSGKLHVPAAKNDAQGYGSALTYARRYSLMAACGIAPEDDDGNAASKAKFVNQSGKSVGAADFDLLSPKRQLEIRELATEVIGEFDVSSADAAYDLYLQTKDAMPLIEEQTAFRGQLPSNVRTAFTKIYNQRKEEKVPA